MCPHKYYLYAGSKAIFQRPVTVVYPHLSIHSAYDKLIFYIMRTTGVSDKHFISMEFFSVTPLPPLSEQLPSDTATRIRVIAHRIEHQH